jgi:5,6-dimethylbenzimidazole synthase
MALAFDAAFRAQLRALLAWRRDVRRFKRDPLPADLVERLIATACLAPSVGLSEPWRFVLVEDAARRRAVRALFEACNAEALKDYANEAARRYATLKLAGLDDAPVQLAVFADRSTPQGSGLGRRTMPETIEYSVVVAIYTLWLAARAEGVGVGWVSILEPAALTTILDVPPDWRLVGYLCLGLPEREDDVPALERAGWEQRRAAPSTVLLRR